MSMPTCFSARDVCAYRVAQLTASGAPRTGAGNGYAGKLIQVTATPQVDQGEDVVQRDGCGDICAFIQDCPTFMGMNLELTLCNLDATAIRLMCDWIGATENPSIDLFGIKAPGLTDGCSLPVSFEWWVKAWDGGVQAEPDATGNQPAYWHFVVPFVYFVPSAWDFKKGINLISLTGKGRENINITSNGPFNDWPSEIAAIDGINTGFGFWLDAALPAIDCNTSTVTSAAS